MNLGKNILKLHDELLTGRFVPSRYVYFVVNRPKPREVFSAHFRDRIVHHLIVHELERIWEKRFIHSSFACRRNKGAYAAIKFLLQQSERVSQGGRRPTWVLQLDIDSFFATISRPILKSLMLENVRHPVFRHLIEVCYSHDARKNYRTLPGACDFAVNPAKSWFRQGPDQGIPIGNLTSQFGANVYLNELDHFIQRRLKPKCYQRYMDDLTLLDTDRIRLESMIEPINEWLHRNRGQKLNPRKTVISELSVGIDFLGYRIRGEAGMPAQLFLPSKKRWAWIESIRELERHGLPPPEYMHPFALKKADRAAKRALNGLNSRLGFLCHAKTYHLRKESLDKLQRAFSNPYDFPKEHYLKWDRFSFGRAYKKIKLR